MNSIFLLYNTFITFCDIFLALIIHALKESLATKFIDNKKTMRTLDMSYISLTDI